MPKPNPQHVNSSRRRFLQTAGAAGAVLGLGSAVTPADTIGFAQTAGQPSQPSSDGIDFPRRFTGTKLSRISFPLGGIGTGCIGLGGRGNLQDWEIFNHPDVGRVPNYCFPVIWARSGTRVPVARVLERRFLPPYDVGPENLGRTCGPGLPRLNEAVFHGGFPLATVDFEDVALPVRVKLEAFSSVQPVDADISGLPVALLCYTVTNPSSEPAEVVIAWSCDNMLGTKGRVNAARMAEGAQGVLMTNPMLPEDDPMKGTVALSVLFSPSAQLKVRENWESSQWNVGESHFWYDEFAPHGDIGNTVGSKSMVCSVSCRQTLAPKASGVFRFMLTWHFPNRTPAGCGWYAVKGQENAPIGNFYCTRFRDAWEVAKHVSAHLPTLEAGTRSFAQALATSTLPPVVLEAASANLTTLVSPTVFRIRDGSFEGFEGCGDKLGMGPGTCTHVWNYEAATAFLYPALSRSMRSTSFLIATDETGHMDFRHYLPPSKDLWGAAAADGQMGQIAKLYQDWKQSGDTEWLRSLWPACKRALGYAWRPGGWDEGISGTLDGVQHNTYDVELYGPNPLCQLWYLAALRGCAEMAAAMADDEFANRCNMLFEHGSRWTDAHLFNGEFYIQQVRGIAPNKIAEGSRQHDGASDPLRPDYQVGPGCLIDQLMGQYLAELSGLGPLVEPEKLRITLQSILRYNQRNAMDAAPSTMRAFAIGEQRALIMCDYTRGGRPKNPFPYFAENFTGSEYAVSVLMMQHGMLEEGVRCFSDVRTRYDGEYANPYSEAEYGRHYARAMSSWAAIPILSGFRYDGLVNRVQVMPLMGQRAFRCIWSAPTGWGMFSVAGGKGEAMLELTALSGRLLVAELVLDAEVFTSTPTSVLYGAKGVEAHFTRDLGEATLRFGAPITVTTSKPLRVGPARDG